MRAAEHAPGGPCGAAAAAFILGALAGTVIQPTATRVNPSFAADSSTDTPSVAHLIKKMDGIEPATPSDWHYWSKWERSLRAGPDKNLPSPPSLSPALKKTFVKGTRFTTRRGGGRGKLLVAAAGQPGGDGLVDRLARDALHGVQQVVLVALEAVHFQHGLEVGILARGAEL